MTGDNNGTQAVTTQAREIVERHEGGALIDMSALSPAEVDVLRSTIAKDCTDDQLRLFLTVAVRSGLDPFRGEVIAAVMNGRLVIMTGIEGYRAIGTRASRVTDRPIASKRGPLWCGEDGQWTDVWLREELPAAARYEIYVEGESEPYVGTALMREAMMKTSDGRPREQWQTRPVHMLGVAAERFAWRQAFPHELAAFSEPELPEPQSGGAPRPPQRSLPAGPGAQRPARPAQAAKRGAAPRLANVGALLTMAHNDMGLSSREVFELLEVNNAESLTALVTATMQGDWERAAHTLREKVDALAAPAAEAAAATPPDDEAKAAQGSLY